MGKASVSTATILSSILLSATVAASQISSQTLNNVLYQRLPSDIKEKGKILAVVDSAYPPFVVIKDGNTLEGAVIDLAQAISGILGVKIEHEVINGFSSMLSGIQGGRYSLSFNPIGDFPERQKKNDFVDFARERSAFAVLSGNPEKIHSLPDMCGKRVAVMSGGVGEKIASKQSAACLEKNKKAIYVQTYSDVATAILAVRSGRADVALSPLAGLSYSIAQHQGPIEIGGTIQEGDFNGFYMGSVLAKDSPLTPIILEAFQQLFDNGTYTAIMKKWNLEGNMLPNPGFNLSKTDRKY